MNKPQATKTTRKQLAYLAHWQARGYTFKPGESAPENTTTPPSFATRHPIADAACGALMLACFALVSAGLWIWIGAGL